MCNFNEVLHPHIFMLQSNSLTCIFGQIPFIAVAKKLTLTSCRHCLNWQQWQVTDPRMAKNCDFIRTTYLKLLRCRCVCGCFSIMGGTNTCMHTHMDTCTLILSKHKSSRAMCSGLTHNIDSEYSGLVWKKTSQTVSLSSPHLIIFNVCV